MKLRQLLRFRLRTLLLLVTAVCLYLGWESHIVRQRRLALEDAIAGGVFDVTLAEDYADRFPPGRKIDDLATVPPVRRLLGDKAVQEIWYGAFGEFTQADLDRLTKLFPEAEIREAHPEPCHPGCFPHGSLVATPEGPRPIETIEVGDEVLSVLTSGEVIAAPVQSVFDTRNHIWQVTTDAGVLHTTETQPLCLSGYSIRQAGQLQAGDRIVRQGLDGVESCSVQSVAATTRTEPVVNLVLGSGRLFIVNGYVVRGKPPRE